MIEVECIYRQIEQRGIEVGQTDDLYVCYFKAARSFDDLESVLQCYLGNWGLSFEVLAKKETPSGNIMKIRVITG